MKSTITVEQLSNGFVVIVEEMPHVESAAYDLLLPGGIVSDPAHAVGASLILAELTSRGAGVLDARALSEAFDDLGVRHGEVAAHDRYGYYGAALAENIGKALELTAEMVLRPTFPEEEIDPIKSIYLQDIASLVDNPAQRAFVELAKRYNPAPYNRPSMGEEVGIRATSISDLRTAWSQSFRPDGAILSVSGNVKTAEIIALAKRLFSDWKGTREKAPVFGEIAPGKVHHIDFESSQLQITMVSPSAKFGDPDYYVAKVATGLLSGGMFGRLFMEVREKRGLCYSVYARHSATNNYGSLMVYAGTTPERAQETLDVTLTELRRLPGTIMQDELSRAKANLKTALIIGEESSSSRASSNASDWWLLKRVRTLDEIQGEINVVSAEAIDAFCKRFPMQPHSLLTLGSRPLEVKPAEIK